MMHTHNHGMSSLARIGYVLVLIGAILLVVFGILNLIGAPFLLYSPVYALGALAQGVLEIILGIICLAGARYVAHLGWGILLLIIGIIAGGLAGDIAGVLIILGAIIGLIARFT